MTTKATILKAIREKCLDFCCGNSAEVGRCHLDHCNLHPYRRGKDPKPSQARAEAARARVCAGEAFLSGGSDAESASEGDS